jgi:hypothetical protein
MPLVACMLLVILVLRAAALNDMRINLGPLLVDESGRQGLLRDGVHGEARINGRKDGLWKGGDCGKTMSEIGWVGFSS